MAHIIHFRSAAFDVKKETPNPINPIAGESALQWLRAKLIDSRYEVTEPEPEDWGWYINANDSKGAYLIGASADAESNVDIDWAIQIHKQRSLKEKITGANKLKCDDPLSTLIEGLIRDHVGITGIEVQKD